MKTIAKPLLDVFRDKGRVMYDSMDFDLTKIGSNKTQIFILSPEIALAAEALVRSKTFAYPDVTTLRFPYPEMAIEIPLTPAVKAVRGDVPGGTHEITRVSACIRSDSKLGFVICTVFWEYEDPTLVQPPFFSFALGMDGLKLPVVRLGLESNRQSTVDFSLLPSGVLADAVARHNFPPEHLQYIYAHETTKVAIKESITELSSLLFACILLINCKSGVTRTHIAARVPPAGIKYGAHKRKQYTASAYTIVHLNEAETVDPSGLVSKRDDLAPHFVRGHFKQRSKGIYWWNTFVRGSGTPRKRIAYRVDSSKED